MPIFMDVPGVPSQLLDERGYSNSKVLLSAFKTDVGNKFAISTNFTSLLELYATNIGQDFVLKLYPVDNEDGLPLYVKVSSNLYCIHLSTDSPISSSYWVKWDNGGTRLIYLYTHPDQDDFNEKLMLNAAILNNPGMQTLYIKKRFDN